MTDVIVLTPQGAIHQYIPDGINQIIYIRPGGTMKVRTLRPDLDQIGSKIASMLR